jgi:hypothetical protein
MAKFKSEELLNELAEDVKRIKESAEYFKTVDKNKMVYTPEKSSWSVVQILEHLNAYNRLYLPQIEKELSIITHDNNTWFNTGFWGEKYFSAMKPNNVFEINKKYKANKKFCFSNNLNVETVLQEFLQHQDKLIALLHQAKKRDLNKIKLPISITKLIKLKLGDIFRVLIAHEQRHLIQARNTLKSVGISTDKFPVILQVVPQ